MTVPSFSADENPGMLYDFNGFEKELYTKVYTAPGSPQLAAIAVTLLAQSGFPAQKIAGRGFDHGVWVPLSQLYPEADIPVVQMAILANAGAGYHIALGRALAPLRQHGVLIIGSGSLTHNLYEVLNGGHAFDAPAKDWVQDFDDWILKQGRGWRDRRYRRLSHPRAPCAGKSSDRGAFFTITLCFRRGWRGSQGKRVHASVERGVMAMDAYILK